MFGESVVVSAEAEDEVTGLSDVNSVSDVLEQEGETFPSGQSRHVTLREGQMSTEGESESRIESKLIRHLKTEYRH